MNTRIVLIAQDFCNTSFCNSDQDADDYMADVETHLERFSTLEEKVQFLVEVKRLGTLAVSAVSSRVEGEELLHLSKLK